MVRRGTDPSYQPEKREGFFNLQPAQPYTFVRTTHTYTLILFLLPFCNTLVPTTGSRDMGTCQGFGMQLFRIRSESGLKVCYRCPGARFRIRWLHAQRVLAFCQKTYGPSWYSQSKEMC
jgi:hypothetical protein